MTNISKTLPPLPHFATLLWRGFSQTCPRCGRSQLFGKFLKLTPSCDKCHQELGHIRADDFPPYLTMLIVGHIVVPSLLLTERLYHPSITVQLAIWLPVTTLLTLWFLPRVKGMIVALMLHLGLQGDETQ